MRCAGFNNVNLQAAAAVGIKVVRVPAYSPMAVAEHAVALIMTLNRKTHKAYNRVREGNFAADRLTGFNLFGKTVGVIGTGKIGEAFCQIMLGFGAVPTRPTYGRGLLLALLIPTDCRHLDTLVCQSAATQ